MNYIVHRKDMRIKLERVLHDFGDCYTVNDIMHAIEKGRMQSFVEGETWIITQVLTFPRKKALDILFVIGHLDEARRALPRLEEYARSIGATKIASLAREGWSKFAGPEWKKTGVSYVKDL